jgi:hypothetical protein
MRWWWINPFQFHSTSQTNEIKVRNEKMMVTTPFLKPNTHTPYVSFLRCLNVALYAMPQPFGPRSFLLFLSKAKVVWLGIQYKCVGGNVHWDWWLLPYVTTINFTTAKEVFFRERASARISLRGETASEVTEPQSYLLHCRFVESGNWQSNVQLCWNLTSYGIGLQGGIWQPRSRCRVSATIQVTYKPTDGQCGGLDGLDRAT